MVVVKRLFALSAFVIAALAASLAPAAAQQQRLALVIGQGAYPSGQLPTTVNDAGLVAQALTSAGFEVIQGRDLNSTDLRRIVRDFLDKAQAAEQGSSAVVYLSGYGVQFEGENYLVPVDARIARDVDVPIEGFRLSDLIRSLNNTPVSTRVIVGDLARDFPLEQGEQGVARGLALVEPPPGFLVAFSSAPNLTVEDGRGPYGEYAAAFVEMLRQPGLSLDDMFSRLRLRTHEATKGLRTPWHASNLGNASFAFFEASDDAPQAEAQVERRIDQVPAEEAYGIALERDTIADYQTFLRTYPDNRMSKRVRALLAARREAIVWRRTFLRDTPQAYWTYLRRYPSGPHTREARRRLARLTAPIEPPNAFDEVVYDDIPAPIPGEFIEGDEIVTILREDDLPPPRFPGYLLPPRDEEDEVIVEIISAPPPPPLYAGVLPIPVAIPIPIRARPPVAFYQPIAPITPRGVISIPVMRPPVFEGPRPPRGTRPRLDFPRPIGGVIPNQPGIGAPVQTIPVVGGQRPGRPGSGDGFPGAGPRPGFGGPGGPGNVGPGGARPGPGGTPVTGPRLPTRPILLPGTGAPPQPGIPNPASPLPNRPGLGGQPPVVIPGARPGAPPVARPGVNPNTPNLPGRVPPSAVGQPQPQPQLPRPGVIPGQGPRQPGAFPGANPRNPGVGDPRGPGSRPNINPQDGRPRPDFGAPPQTGQRPVLPRGESLGGGRPDFQQPRPGFQQPRPDFANPRGPGGLPPRGPANARPEGIPAPNVQPARPNFGGGPGPGQRPFPAQQGIQSVPSSNPRPAQPQGGVNRQAPRGNCVLSNGQPCPVR